MVAPYDSFDYLSYWQGRDYEHKSENVAIKFLLGKISHIEKVLEVGAGFGRLVPAYAYRAKKVILSDPSAKILNLARKNLKDQKKVEFIQSALDNLPNKFKKRSFDLIIMVRVLHHIRNTRKAFGIIASLVKNNGYFVLELPNKNHIKANLTEIIRGNFSYLYDRNPIDIRGIKSVKAKTIPFFNYHPEQVEEDLRSAGFEIVDKLSVSNIRSPFLKKYVSVETLLAFEKLLQKPLGFCNFGPSIFILAKKHPIS